MSNETDSMLCLWVEPGGTDHWMRPGGVFTVVTQTAPEESPFDVLVPSQSVRVWVNSANDSEVFDKNGLGRALQGVLAARHVHATSWAEPEGEDAVPSRVPSGAVLVPWRGRGRPTEGSAWRPAHLGALGR
ncbi:hypothetical protein ACF1G0_31610 [Streptomyces sp. NPDC013953]|uniref:hypothetical protein n=1 Tax=Streptomyces sp. NPDC013953 TaxID=3364868 RepID=UPI0036F8816C